MYLNKLRNDRERWITADYQLVQRYVQDLFTFNSIAYLFFPLWPGENENENENVMIAIPFVWDWNVPQKECSHHSIMLHGSHHFDRNVIKMRYSWIVARTGFEIAEHIVLISSMNLSVSSFAPIRVDYKFFLFSFSFVHIAIFIYVSSVLVPFLLRVRIDTHAHSFSYRPIAIFGDHSFPTPHFKNIIIWFSFFV